MLTKSDLSQIKSAVQEVIRPQINGLDKKIDSLQQSTEKDMKGLETRLMGRIDEAQMEIIATVDKHKADKARVDILEKRVVRLEDNSGLPPFADQ